MRKVFQIAANDLRQLVREKMTFIFFLIMPILLTLLLGFALKSPQNQDLRQPITVISEEPGAASSSALIAALENSSVVRVMPDQPLEESLKKVADKDLAGVVIVPQGYGQSLQTGQPLPLRLIGIPNQANTAAVSLEIERAAGRLASAALTARALSDAGAGDFSANFADAQAEWQAEPLKLHTVPAQPPGGQPVQIKDDSGFAHSSPGMLLQFAIAGLMTCAQVIVSERRNNSLNRLLTLPVSRWQVVLGHYLSIFSLILLQFLILILFGQFILNLDYLRQPLATIMTAVSSAACISAIGLFLGVVSKTQEHAAAWALVLMFALSALGGAWIPLEIAGKTFQAIGHISPVAWAMDGFKNVIVRGLGPQANLMPMLVLLAMGLPFLLASFLTLRPR